MSDRPPLKLYALDRPALQAVSAELRDALEVNDRDALAALLELAGPAAEPLAAHDQVVELFLRPESHPVSKVLFASLRRISRKRAMREVFRSDDPALEGRLRAFEVLRQERDLATGLDKLLDPHRLPWYLRRQGATGGWVDGRTRARMAEAMAKLRPALPPEITTFADALAEIDADAIAHDAL